MDIWCNYETAFWISSSGVIFVNKFTIQFVNRYHLNKIFLSLTIKF
jgi:hypothetical protein